MSIRKWLHRVVGNDTELVVQNTGESVSTDGSRAVTGYSGPERPAGKLTVQNTGNATATGGGAAVSGIDYTDRKRKS